MTLIEDKFEKSIVPLLERQRLEKNIPAISISVVDSKNILWQCHLGSAKTNSSQKPTNETLYSAGSITKTFVAILAMQLVSEGKLNIDTPVTTYMPSFGAGDAIKSSITIKHLLQHNSGLPREVPGKSYFRMGFENDVDVIAALNKADMIHAPGEVTSYCNAGFALLGKVIETVSSRPLKELIQEKIFDPAGLSTATLGRPTDDGMIAEAVMNPAIGSYAPAPTVNPGPAPTGGLFASVQDLSVYMQCLLANDGTLLPSEHLASMWERDGMFGLSFFLRELDGYKTIGHGGTFYGYATEMEILPERNLGVVVFTTHDIANNFAQRLVHHIARSVIAIEEGSPLPIYPESTALNPELSEALTGVYAADGMTISIEGGSHPTMEIAGHRSSLRQLDNNHLALDSAKIFLPGIQYSDDHSRLEFAGMTLTKISDDPYVDDIDHPLSGHYGNEPSCPIKIFRRGEDLYAELVGLFVSKLDHVKQDKYTFSPQSAMFAGESLEFILVSGIAKAILLNGEPLPRINLGN